MLKKGYLEHTKDKSVTEVTKKIVTEMMPDKEKEYNRNQYIQSLQHRRRKITFEVPDALLNLPTNILKETVLEKKKLNQFQLNRSKFWMTTSSKSIQQHPKMNIAL